MQKSFTLFGNNFGDACPPGFEIIDDVFHFVQLAAIFKYRKPNPSAQ